MTCVKGGYPNRYEAERALRALKSKGRSEKSYYVCTMEGCGQWHLTSAPSQTPSQRRKRRRRM